ncbi:IS3 family transposase [Myxococcota bacterium]
MSSRKRRRFTKEFRAEAVKLALESNKTAAEVARDLGVSGKSLRDWIKQHEIDRGKGPVGALTTEEKQELARLRRENRELRMERENIKKSDGLLRQGKSMRFTFIDAERASFPVTTLCRVLQVTRNGFYAWLKRPESRRRRRDRQLAVKIKAFHQASRGTYGSPRIYDDLKEEGESVSKKRVARIMRENGVSGRAKPRRKRTTDSNHNLPVAENLLNRDFSVAAPDRVWASDITYVRTWEGWLYLAVVIDLFSRRVIGWAIADHMRTELVLDAVKMAIGLRNPAPGLIHHSDRGSQYASHDYQRTLEAHGMLCSMSRKGDCWDNAVVESFFGSLKDDLIYRFSWPTKARAKKAIAEYIACFFNSRRRHSFLGNVSPMEYENTARQLRLAV